MTGSGSDHPPEAGAADLADAAQRVAGILAARHRGDPDGVAALMDTFPDERALAGGSLLLAQLLLQMYGQQTNQTVDQCVQELSTSLARATG